MTHPHLAPATERQALEFGLSADEYRDVLRHMGRTPNVTELGIFSVMWSEHCSYKSSRVHLAKFPTSAPHVIYGPGENAGAIDLGEGLACIFKMESHNHPSYIEPYQGAATGVGGILRDVFTMGARPVALMNALRFGDPSHEKTRHLVGGVVAGIAGYGNCVGVPTVGGETNFHSGYNGNILVNVMCVGLAPKDRIFTSAAKGANNPVVYVGAKTGRDGIHGATMASAEFSEEAESQRPTVQMGDPFLEKLLIEACLELMQHDVIIGIQDMGAAGLTSSTVEMASKGGAGVELDVDLIPAREENMSPYEFMLSESQERMLMTLKPGHEEEAMAIFHKWGLDAVVIGKTTDTGRLVLKWHGEIAADMPLGPLADEAPKYNRPFVKPVAAAQLSADVLARPHPSPIKALATLMASPDMASKRWLWQQYDRHVMADTLADSESGGDAALVRIHGSHRALAISTDVTPRYVQADPYEGGKQAVAECWRNLTAVGARPLAVTDNLNFGNPQKPETMGQIVAAIEGLAEACRALDFPVISGNVSLYNETDGEPIPPTPAIGGVGIIDDLSKRADMRAMKEKDVLILIGEAHGHLGASLYLREVLGVEAGAPPPVNLAEEKRNGDFVRKLIIESAVAAVHDLSDGGLLCAAAEMALAANVGALIFNSGDLSPAAFAFGEDQARYLLAVPAEREQAIYAAAREAEVYAEPVGVAGSREILFGDEYIALDDLRAAHEGWMPAYMSKAA
ncbi:MAG TPA: phosphoribosylformylglycinamidine synthase subunit PurL [Caulobacterales bacterium]|nr:phosphoribosylformylglycinamidine synthase subunit PurL [Caulobacterales bacterium]